MLTRSLTPAHGVGRSASSRDAWVAVKPPAATSSRMVPIE